MNALRLIITVLSAVFLVLLALYEVGFGFPAPWWVYLIVTLLFVFSLTLALKGRWRPRTLVVPVLGIIAAWVFYFVPWSTRKPFLRDLDRIQAGMSEEEVREIMSSYMEGTGWPAVYGGESPGEGTMTDLGSGERHSTTSVDGQLAINNAIVFRHSDDGAYNSDWGIVKFEAGRVVSVDFSPD